MAETTGGDQLFGERLHGTGGDIIDRNDVEGHMSDQDRIDQGGPEGAAGGIRVRTPNVAGDDTEGHRGRSNTAIPGDEGGPEGVKNDRWKGERADGADDDVEGHRRYGGYQSADGSEPEGYGRSPRPQTLDGADDDVEGHRRYGGYLEVDGGPEGANNDRWKGSRIDGSDDDVEGHIYTGGPSTQGEFTKRGPGENPHGERHR